MSFIKQPFQLAPEDNTLIYALGEKAIDLILSRIDENC